MAGIALTLAACSKSDTSGRVPLDASAATTASTTSAQGAQSGAMSTPSAEASGPKLPLAAMAALDAGNAAYRAQKFDVAVAKYREAAAAAPKHAAPWFGLYMAANEMKNTALADSAMKQVKTLSADPATLTAHAEVSSPSANPPTPGLPPGHPNTQAPMGHPKMKLVQPGHPVTAPNGATDTTKRVRM